MPHYQKAFENGILTNVSLENFSVDLPDTKIINGKIVACDYNNIYIRITDKYNDLRI